MTLYSRSGDSLRRGLVRFYKCNDRNGDVGNTVLIDYAKLNNKSITGAINGVGLNSKNANSLYFDGSDDRISAHNDAYLFDNTFSISAWLLETSSIDSGALVSAYNGGTIRYNIYITSTKAEIKVRLADTSYLLNFQSNNPFIILDRWVHYVWVDNKGKYQLYKDGVLDTTGEYVFTVQGYNSMQIMDYGSSAELRANLTNFRIYDRALTQGEVSKLYRLRK